MGFLGKAPEKTIETAAATGKAEKIIHKLDVVNQKISHFIGMKTEEEIIEGSQDDYQLVIMQNVSNVDFFFGDVDWRNCYFAYDKSRKQQFAIKGNVVMGKHHFSIYNNNKKEIGKVKRKLITIPILFEKEAKECDIIIDGELFGTLRSYVFFGQSHIEFSANEWAIEQDKSRYEFSIYYKKNQIGHVYKVVSSYKDNECKDKYMIGYEDKKYEHECLMIAIAIDTIFFLN